MKLADLVVRFAYWLEESSRYRRFKQAAYDLLENPHSRIRPYFDLFMMVLVLTSVFILLYDVRHTPEHWAVKFENLVLVVLVLEYLGRFWVYDDIHKHVIEAYEESELVDEPFRLRRAFYQILQAKWTFVSSPMAVIDLLAIMPSYRPLRILRLFVLFRLFKLFRYTQNLQEFGAVLREKKAELLTLLTFLLFILIVGSSAIYLFESSNYGGDIDGFFEGIYWALVTLSTVGYGDITPHSFEGRLVTMVLILSGIGVISFFTSIVVSAFQEKLGEVRERQVCGRLQKLKDYTVICGYGRVGAVVADYLHRDRHPFVIIDENEEAVAAARRANYLAVHGKAQRLGALHRLGVGANACRVLALTGDDVVNVYITLTARQLDSGIEIISRANHHRTVKKLELAGANHAIEPYKIVGLIAGEYIGQPVAFEAIQGILMGDQEIDLEAVRVPPGSWLDGKRVEDAGLGDLRLILFGVITPPERESDHVRHHYDLTSRRFQFNPGPDFVLVGDDLLLVFGHRYSILRLRHKLKL